MMSERQTARVALLCDTQGTVLQVIHDGLGLGDQVAPGRPLALAVDRGSLSKILGFLTEVQEKGGTFDWELNVPVAGQLVTLHFAGVAADEQLLIVGAKTSNGAMELYEEIARIGNEQANALRATMKECAELTRHQAEMDICREPARPPRLQPASAVEEDTEPVQDRRLLRVLLAEDDLGNRRLAVKMLTRQGHTVVAVEDGRQAVEAWQREPFDLILMDMHMPELDGIQAAAAIREMERNAGAHIPIIALTASQMVEDIERCREAGMDDCLTKPLSFQMLDDLPTLERSVRQAATASVPGSGGGDSTGDGA